MFRYLYYQTNNYLNNKTIIMKNSIIAIIAIIISFTYTNAQTITPTLNKEKVVRPLNFKTSLGGMLLGKYKLIGEGFISEKESIEFEIGASGSHETLYYTERRNGIFASARYKYFYKVKNHQGLYIAPGFSVGQLRSTIDLIDKNRTNFASFIDTGFQFNIASFVTDMFIGIGYSSNVHAGEITGTHTTITGNLAGRIGFRTGLTL